MSLFEKDFECQYGVYAFHTNFEIEILSGKVPDVLQKKLK